MNKSAKEMFEELGYKMDDEWVDAGDLYYYKGTTNCKYAIEIWFDLIDKRFAKYINDDYCEGDVNCITMQELQAINKQVEELWGKQDGNMEEN